MFANHVKAVRYFLMLMFSVIWFSGCATQIRPVMPSTSNDIAIKAKFIDLGLMRPFGSYDMDGSSFIVGKATNVTMGEAAFGALGAIAAHNRGKAAAKEVIADHESIFAYDLVSEVESIVKNESKNFSGKMPLNADLPIDGNSVMELEPWVYIGVSEDGKKGTVSVYMRTFLKNEQGKQVWRSGYNYQSQDSRPFEGEDGWFADDGSNLRQVVGQCYKEAAKVMMMDLQGAEAGWKNEPAKIKVSIPGAQKPIKVEATLLKQKDGMIIYTPKTGKAGYIYGVNIVPESEVEILKE